MNRLLRGATLGLAGLGLLVACGSDDGGTEPNGMVVSGSVRDFGGEPIGGATVLVPGGRPVTTGSDGRFSISGVGTPYDIAVIVPGPNAVAPNSAVIYQGLTRSNPSLLSPYFTGPTRAATIGGKTAFRIAINAEATIAPPSPSTVTCGTRYEATSRASAETSQEKTSRAGRKCGRAGVHVGCSP